jgi:hypothetical protein
MITIFLIILTWYFTKLFYTRSMFVKFPRLEDDGLLKAVCAKCAQTIVIAEKNLRTPFYCVACK